MPNRTLLSTLTVLAVVGGTLAACDGGSGAGSTTATKSAGQATAAPAEAPPSPQAQAAAHEIFTTRCVTCHGTEGKGNGPASAGLAVHPRDFTNAEWQASVTDEHLRKIIMYGGTAVGKSAMMPPNPDLMAKPDVVAALAAHVRSLNGH